VFNVVTLKGKAGERQTEIITAPRDFNTGSGLNHRHS